MSSDPPPKPPLWADIVLSVWVAFVGILYYGGFFSPRLTLLTGAGAAFYGALLLGGAVALALRFLGHRR